MTQRNDSAKPKTGNLPSQSRKMSDSDKAALEKKIAEQQEEQTVRHLDNLEALVSKPTWLSRFVSWIKGA